MEKPINKYTIQMGKYVRDKRIARGMKQAKLAEDAGLSERYISKFEHGKKDARFRTVHKLCIALDMDYGAFMKYLDQYRDYLYDE